MTTQDTAETAALIKDLASAFVARPRDVEIGYQQAESGETYLALKGHPEDESRLIGKAGSHVKALTFLVGRFGRAAGRVYTFRLITEQAPRARLEQEPRNAVTYDPQAAKGLLERLLEALELGEYAVTVGPGISPRHYLNFVFKVHVRFRTDYAYLITPDNPQLASDMTVVGAIGTIFRAIAKQAGVRFTLIVEEPQ